MTNNIQPYYLLILLPSLSKTLININTVMTMENIKSLVINCFVTFINISLF